MHIFAEKAQNRSAAREERPQEAEAQRTSRQRSQAQDEWRTESREAKCCLSLAQTMCELNITTAFSRKEVNGETLP